MRWLSWEDIVREICEALDIPNSNNKIPSIKEIKDKFKNAILNNESAQLSDYQYSLAEQSFVFDIIYGANYQK